MSSSSSCSAFSRQESGVGGRRPKRLEENHLLVAIARASEVEPSSSSRRGTSQSPRGTPAPRPSSASSPGIRGFRPAIPTRIVAMACAVLPHEDQSPIRSIGMRTTEPGCLTISTFMLAPFRKSNVATSTVKTRPSKHIPDLVRYGRIYIVVLFAVPPPRGAASEHPAGRSAAGAVTNSIRRPSAGCVKTSRAACRNGRSDADRRISPGTRRWTPPYSGSPTIGWPIALRCTRI